MKDICLMWGPFWEWTLQKWGRGWANAAK